MDMTPDQFKKVLREVIRDEAHGLPTKKHFDKRMDKLQTTMDGVAKKVDTIEQEQTVYADRLKSVEIEVGIDAKKRKVKTS